MTAIFKLSHISKIYNQGKPSEVKAIDDVSLEIYPGEFSALVGPSGSGKSTLLNLMSGLDKVSSGQISLKGHDLSKISEKKLSDFRRDHIGFIFQSFNLIPVLKVYENIEYVMLLQGVSKNSRKAKVMDILEELGLGGLENKYPNELSGGQQQRVAVARAVVAKPDIILADEPTANLDSENGTKLLDMMQELNQRHHATFIFSTHDSLIMERAHRLIRMRDGRLIDD